MKDPNFLDMVDEQFVFLAASLEISGVVSLNLFPIVVHCYELLVHLEQVLLRARMVVRCVCAHYSRLELAVAVFYGPRIGVLRKLHE